MDQLRDLVTAGKAPIRETSMAGPLKIPWPIHMRRVRIEKVADSTLSDQWFDGIEIDLNPGLIAITQGRVAVTVV